MREFSNSRRHGDKLYIYRSRNTNDIGSVVSVGGVPWMKQYLDIENMKSVKCNQPFVFGPSKKYISESLKELPILVTRIDRKEDVLTVQTYLVDAEVPFLCGKQTLETWNFKIDGQEKNLRNSLENWARQC